MKMRKCMALVLSLLMLFGLTACGAETADAEEPAAEAVAETEEAAAETEEAAAEREEAPVAEEKVTTPAKIREADGAGRVEITVDGVSVCLGDTLGDILEPGAELDDEDALLELAPWQHKDILIENSEGDLVHIDVLNDSEDTRSILDCRTYFIDGNCAVEDIAINGVTTDELSRENLREIFAGEDILLDNEDEFMAGSSVNYFYCDFDEDTIRTIEVLYLEDIFNAYSYEYEGEMIYSTDHGIMARYMDVAAYEDVAPNCGREVALAELSDSGMLEITVAGETISLGENGHSYNELADYGWKLREFDADHELLEPGQILSAWGDPVSIEEQAIPGLLLSNFADTTIPSGEGKIVSITLENADYYGHVTVSNCVDFEFCGITKDSTLTDVIANLGNPTSFSCFIPKCQVTMTYKVDLTDGTGYDTGSVVIVADYMTEEIVQVQIST